VRIVNKKIKGGALQFVLFIGAVIAILLLTFISLTYSHRFFQKRGGFVLTAVGQANNGINYLLHNDIPIKDSVALRIGDDSEEIIGNSLTAYRKYWGLFELFTVHSVFHHQEFTKVALTGGYYKEENRYSLYLCENNRPLVVVENAELHGKLLLPKEGVRPGNMGGKSFTGILPSQNNIGQSNSQLPEILTPITENIKLWLQGKFDSTMEQISMNDPLDLKISFKKNTKLLYSYTSLSLAEGNLVGNIIVYSSSRVYIGKSMKIKDVIIIAPEIEIEKGFQGSLQAIASKEIIVNDKVSLKYPSSLVLYNKNMSYPNAAIAIGDHALIQGAVVYWDDNREGKQFFNSQIKIKEGAIVEGEVYCARGVELLGKVKGSVTTSYFIVNKFGAVYQNHIYGGKINIELLHENYAGMLYQGNDKRVMKWLY